MTPMDAVVFSEVTIRYGPDGPAIVARASFSIDRNERVALLGLNGSGKTTLLLSIVGLVPFEGTIGVNGTLLTPTSVGRIRDDIGYLFNVPEDQLLFPKVVEDVAFSLISRNTAKRQAVETAMQTLTRFGIGHLAQAPLHHLSHGQKQRVALSGALVAKPSLLLLDEPTSGLDPPGKAQLARILVEQPSAMIVATHDLAFAEQVCSRFLLIEGGGLTEAGRIEEVRDRWAIG